MILLGKFSETIGFGDSLKDNFDKSKKCVEIADDYAIEFAEWVDKNAYWLATKRIDELLEIFKKEKGL
jgi:hypothetical protein